MLFLLDRREGDLVIAQLIYIVLLFELLFVFDAAARKQPEAKTALIDGGFEHFKAHPHEEKSDKLSTDNDDEDQNRVLDLLSFRERVILACLEE